MKLEKLEYNHKTLELFFKSGNNIWLSRALQTNMAKAMRREAALAIRKQIEFITPDRIALITHRLTKFNYEYFEILTAIFTENKFITYFSQEMLDKFYKEMGVLGGKAAHSKIGIEISFELKNDALIRQLGQREDYLIRTVDRTTKAWLAEQIQAGVNEGLDNREIAKRIHESGKDIALWRAELIAHAETAFAMNTVEHNEMIQMGITRKMWITSNDDRVTLECSMNQDKGSVPMDYRYGSEGVLYPPRFSRCRCYIQPDISLRNKI